MPLPANSSSSRWLGAVLFGLGIVLAVITCGILAMHARTFSLKRDTAVIIGTTLPALRSSVTLLRANREAEEFFARHALSSREEQASVYVLPEGPSSARAIRALHEIALTISKSAADPLAISTVSFDPAHTDHGSYKTVDAHLKLRGSFASVARFLLILSYSGDMMVRDVLGDEKSEQFLQQVEVDSPMALKRSEDFLSLDLMEYAADPDQAESLMLQDIPAELRADLRSFVLRSGVAQVRGAFEHIANDLRGKNIWPLPLVSVGHLEQKGDEWMLELMFYRR